MKKLVRRLLSLLSLLMTACSSTSRAVEPTPISSSHSVEPTPPALRAPELTPTFTPCKDDKSRLAARSQELAVLVQSDQNDRKNWNQKSAEEMLQVAGRDVSRRRRVGEIFGEGCFSTAADYSAAALVFQHGDMPDHFFQTFVWAKRAVELGNSTQKRTMALGIDRYLVSVSQKQLFGSQAFLSDFKPETCWCLWQIERSFPDQLRKEVAGQSLDEAFAWLQELNSGKVCPVGECMSQLKASPKGAVPGFW